MTKLMQWVFAINLFFAIYAAIVLRQIQSDFFEKFMFEIQILPVILIGLFGIYAVTTVLYRVFTFNDCKEAAEEIQKQILEAKKDLKSKGFKFVE